MNKKLIISVLIILTLIISLIGIQRSLVYTREDVENYKSNLAVQYQRRNDLIPNILSTVKAQAKQEKEIYTQIAELRGKLNEANKTKGLQQNQEVSESLSRLLVIVENYPNLKQNEGFENLRLELTGTENRIATSRENYNEAVRVYKNKIKVFPNNFFSSMFGFYDNFEYIEVDKNVEKVPELKFE